MTMVLVMSPTLPSSSSSLRRQQLGVSLIELLVAILIFAFGMLGLAGLQNRTLGFSQVSLYRSQATALSDDVLDRMRADRASAKSGGWDTKLETTASDMSTATFAERDLKEWKSQVESLLPDGQALVKYEAAQGGRVKVDIRWNERDAKQSEWVTYSAL